MSRLAVNVRYLRNCRGWTQRELAVKADVPQSSVHYIESGVRSPRLNTVEKLAAALGVSVAAILDNQPEATKKGRE